ncbi:hypothetical protein GUITHDRAFT_60557, partial [Guillardia theta CCMP2712]
FNFESLAGPDSSQEEIFETVGREACEAFLDGFNAAIFAYGQTGSGKTHTMYGSLEEREGAGLIPRSLEFILGRMQQNFSGAQHVALRCCLLEIYNEQVIDLLVAESRPLQIRERMDDGVTFAEGACSPLVRSLSEALELLRGGIARRRVGATCANECSSRSHCILSLFLDVREEDKAKMVVKTSALHLVDLAGSERQNQSRSEGKRLKEANNINRSLSALGNVILSLGSGSRHIPYRDSKLTFLLRNSIGGNSKTFLIANVSNEPVNFGETISTLKFASSSSSSKLLARRN